MNVFVSRGRWRSIESARLHRSDFHVEIEAILQWSADARLVAAQQRLAAAAWHARMAEVAAGARIRSRDQQHCGGKARPLARALQADLAFLQGLAQALEDRTRELRELVEEEHSAMCPRELPRAQGSAAAEQSLCRGAHVGRTERRPLQQSAHRSEQRLDLRELERALRVEILEQSGQPAREHALAGAWRSLQPERVRAERRDHQGLACLGLPTHFVEAQAGSRGDFQGCACRGTGEVVLWILLAEASGDFGQILAPVHREARGEAGFPCGFERSDHAQHAPALHRTRGGERRQQSAACRRTKSALQIEFGEAKPGGAWRRPLRVCNQHCRR